MKWYCTVCGYVHEGDQPPEQCPVCKQPASKFKKMEEEAEYATVHKLGEGKMHDTSEDIIKDLRANFEGECSEVGMYLAMARVADREGYPEVAEAFKRYAFEEAEYATVHKLGEGKAEGVSEDIIKDLKANFEGECAEVGMYLAMARVADREGYPEIAEAFKRYAFEEADHASRFAELLGEVLTDSTEKNLKMRADAEAGACEGKFDLAKRAKAAGLDAIHDTVHEMAKDEARHGAGFKGLLKRYFG